MFDALKTNPFTMRYKVRHLTTYEYLYSGGLSYNEAWLQPRNLPYQQVLERGINISPQPTERASRQDFFGNQVDYFAVQQTHKNFAIDSTSIIERRVPAYAEVKSAGLSWETWRDELKIFHKDRIEVRQFCLPSPLIPYSDLLKEFALVSFQPGRDLLEALHELNHRIYKEFEYKQGFTTVATPLKKVIEARKGVCQDFAHVAISCLRTLGLPARYVSGYIETLPPEGADALVGSAASHAWFASFVPGIGWVDFDPTNNKLAKEQHITVAWGRDYTDVPPIKGVIFNAGPHELSVSVDVIRIK